MKPFGEKIVKIMRSNGLLVIILVSLVLIGAVILIDLLSFSNVSSLMTEQLKDNQLINTEHAANLMENHILEVKDELVTLSKFPEMKTLDADKCTGDAKSVHQKVEGKINSLLKVDRDGNIIESSSPFFSDYIGLNIKNKEYFSVPKETNEPYIAGDVKEGSSTQVIISVPLFETTKYTPYPNFLGDFKGELLSILEVNNLYTLYIHHIVEPGKNYFLLINLNTEETILKSDDIGEYSRIKGDFPKTSNGFNIISDFEGFGKTIITSSDMALGSETWRLIVLTPLKNTGEDIKAAQQRRLFSLGFIVIVIIAILYFMISLYRSKEKVESRLEKTNITLEKLGINVEVEEGKKKYTQADITLEPRKIYLVKEDEENHAHELFISTLNRGFAGLGIVRENPNEIKRRYNLQKTSFIWLTNTKTEGMACESNIGNLFELISEFVKKSRKSVVLLDRLDYILTENNFEDVMKRIHSLKDLALANECIMIISANPGLVEESKLKRIEIEAVDIYGRHLRKGAELSDMEMNILKYINDSNVINRLVSYKDITDNFKITKPTTRVKISRLQGLGLLQVEQRGRFKSLKITSSGRRMMG